MLPDVKRACSDADASVFRTCVDNRRETEKEVTYLLFTCFLEFLKDLSKMHRNGAIRQGKQGSIDRLRTELLCQSETEGRSNSFRIFETFIPFISFFSTLTFSGTSNNIESEVSI